MRLSPTKMIVDFIFQNDGVTQEYPLLKHIESHYPNFFAPLGDNPSLFKKHFLLFNQLYRLQDELKAKNLALIISPLEIRIISHSETGESHSLQDTDRLKAFYSDFDNIYLSDEEVSRMQRKFWEKYLALDEKAAALKTLGLSSVPQLTSQVLKRRFSELANQCHPDKGGDGDEFIKIKKAYKALKRLVKDN